MLHIRLGHLGPTSVDGKATRQSGGVAQRPRMQPRARTRMAPHMQYLAGTGHARPRMPPFSPSPAPQPCLGADGKRRGGDAADRWLATLVLTGAEKRRTMGVLVRQG